MNNRLSPLKFLTTYNKRGATKNIQCPDKPLHCKAFRASFTLSAAGYVAAGYAIICGELPLGAGRLAIQAIALTDDIGLTLCQTLIHQLTDTDMAVPGVQVLQHGILYAYDVHQKEVVAILVCIQGI